MLTIKPGLPSKKGYMIFDPKEDITPLESCVISIALAQYMVIRKGFNYWGLIEQYGAERHFRNTSDTNQASSSSTKSH